MKKRFIMSFAVLVILLFQNAYGIENPKAVSKAATLDKQMSTVTSVYAGIEIGAKGVKSIVFEVREAEEDDEIVDIKQLHKQNINTTIVSGIQNGGFSKDSISETAKAVNEIYKEIKKFSPTVTVCVGSSAVAKGTNKEELVSAIKDLTALETDFINKDQEVFYGIISSIPKKRWNSSILIDIGSGNTKVGYIEMLEKTPRLEALEIPFGTVTLKEQALKKGDNYRDELGKLLKEEVTPLVKAQAQKKPALSNRKRIFIIGGTPWAVSNFTHPEMIKRKYVKLSLQDVDMFSKSLVNKGEIVTPDLSGLDKETQEKALKEFSKIKDVFTYEDLLAGSLLLKTTLSALHGTNRYLIFPRDSGWIGGYALLKGMHE